MPAPKHILVVEDIAIPGRHTGRLLRRYGYSVTTAGSALEVSALTRQFDCGVFDCTLPDGDGVHLARKLLAASVIRRAVFFCGSHDHASAERAFAVGPCVDRNDGIAELERVIAGRPARTRSGVHPLGDTVPSSRRSGSR